MNTPIKVPDLSDPLRADVEVPAVRTREDQPLAALAGTRRGAVMVVLDLSDPRRANVEVPAKR